MSHTTGPKAMKDFAAEYGLRPLTVSDIVAYHNLPYQQIGNAKALPPATQKDVLRILGIKSNRQLASAS